jgi:hypothetical protein
LPADTPITQMLSPEEAEALTPAAAKLTKAELLAMSDNTAEAASLNLTVDDLKSIQDAFHQQLSTQHSSGMMTANSYSACCSTPCCCCTAAAVPDPVRLA